MDNVISNSYLNQVQAYPLLSAEEETALADKIAAGDKAAYNALVNSNLRLVISISYKFNTSQISVMDLIQEGNLGLMTAAQKFSSAFKTRFSTYAYPWIMQYMLRYIDSRAAFISVPHRRESFLKKIREAQGYLFQQNGRDASESEISAFLGVPEEKVRENLECSYKVSSLDAQVQGSCAPAASVGDLIPDTKYSPEVQFMDAEEKKSVRRMMSELSDREEQVIYYRYNFDGETHTKTLRELSSIMGISPEAVRQTEIRALKRMKNAALATERMFG